MKCYTINETAARGIRLTGGFPIEDPILRVGEPGSCTSLPVSRDIRAAFEERNEFIRRMRVLMQRCGNEATAESAERELREELHSAQRDNPGLLQQVNAVARQLRVSPHLAFGNIWAEEKMEVMSITNADISDNEPLRLIKERAESPSCLVHVVTKAPIDGAMWFEASSWDEEEVETRWGPEVTRIYRPFPPRGVKVVAQGVGPSGEPEALLLMTKRASFRICRSGDPSTFEDGPDDPERYPVLVVVWPGSSLRCFPPRKYEKEKTAA